MILYYCIKKEITSKIKVTTKYRKKIILKVAKFPLSEPGT